MSAAEPDDDFFGGPEPTDGPELDGVTHGRTDLRNAERLVEWYGEDIRYVALWRKWLAWDGQRWALDDAGGAQRRAKETARRLLALALVAQREATEALARAVGAGDAEAKDRAEVVLNAARADVSHAIRSQAAARLNAMLDVARSDPAIVISHTCLDADPWLLNVSNGTLDLRTGRLRPHLRSDLCTKLAPVAYDATATCPTWDAFLARVMGDSTELVGFLQRMSGYSLTGVVTEHVLAFLYGGGANGKSTFLGVIHAVLGDYATPAGRGLLFRSRGERHPTELATLHGRRYVTCSEIEDGQAFDEALVKDLTGNDLINARRMREDEWKYPPSHKLWLAGNYKPTVRGDDEGIWRRMRLVPFTVTIPEAERDTALPEKLRAELSGILAWAVRGCLAWQRDGLDAPAAVRDATREYRSENDLLGQFFQQHVRFGGEDAIVPRRELRDTYERFCGEAGTEPLGAKRFSSRLRERGVRETTARGEPRMVNGKLDRPVVNAWRGVRLATDTEREGLENGLRNAPAELTSQLPTADRRHNGASKKEQLGTCGEEIPGQTPLKGVRAEVNSDLATTSTYVPTDPEAETLADYLEREGIEVPS